MQQESNFNEPDPFYADAITYVREQNKVNVTMLQRKFRLGYNRAARLIEDMQKEGVISDMDNQGRRKVLKF